MTMHSHLMGEASQLQYAVQGDKNRVELLPPNKEPMPITAIVGSIEVGEEEITGRETIQKVTVERRSVTVNGGKLGAMVPDDTWQVNVDGEKWPVERVTGVGSEFVVFHLKQNARKRLGTR